MVDRNPLEEDISNEEQALFNAAMDRYLGIEQSPSHTTFNEVSKEK